MRNNSVVLLAPLAAFALAACETVPPGATGGFTPGMTMVVTGVCQTRAAALTIAEAGARGEEEAEAAARAQYRSGACRYWADPSLMVSVRSVIHSYRDYRGRPSQVLLVRNPEYPDMDLYTLTLTERARSREAGN